MPPKKDPGKVGKKGKDKQPSRQDFCSCGVLVVQPQPKKKKKKKPDPPVQHNAWCTFQRAPCPKYAHLLPCEACAANQRGEDADGEPRKCRFMFRRNILGCGVVPRPREDTPRLFAAGQYGSRPATAPAGQGGLGSDSLPPVRAGW
eukprot:TRINITY_DN70368_c0_g1_i1.p3 TRINITY_DN70368_c0_g1~~TRINITY_DN70368_c0_g1_i1.p3  ORF type:complete len:146 (+),score=32.08 TRINITY_DN70368_c0_g1_i1:125-562(+)